MKALTIGGAMIDTIAVIANERVERMTMRNAETSFLLLEEGRKAEAEDISTHCGGGAVNAAVSLARLGHDVSTLVKLGQDMPSAMRALRLVRRCWCRPMTAMRRSSRFAGRIRCSKPKI
jgi:sugar/nucleoside kinase (ribokinase family)